MTELEVIGSQILIFNSGGAQIRRHNSNVVRLTKVKSEERRAGAERKRS